jgi:predicted Zn-dependent protease
MASRIDAIKEMLLKEPEDAFLNYALALELEKENKITEAIAVIGTIIARDENYLGGYYKLGKLHEAAGEKEKARTVYENGVLIARKQKNAKTMNELNEAIQQLEE